MATNPFTLDYAQFLEAMKPYASADGSAYQWASPEGQNGSVGLTLANGKTWTPSGAASGVNFVPKGTKIYKGPKPGTNSYEKYIGQYQKPEDDPKYYSAPTTEDTWKISGDMSALLGQNDTNAHKTIDYVLQDGKLVPKNENDWQYQNNGLGGFVKDVVSNPAFQAFGLLAGGAALSGLGGGAAASSGGALDGLLAADAASSGMAGAYGSAMGGMVGSGAAAGAGALDSLLGQDASTAAMQSAYGTGTGAATGASSMNLLDFIPSGVKDVTGFLKDNAGLLGAIGGAIGSNQDQTQSTTASKEPWSAAAPWMKSNLATGQELQKWYQSNPFNAQQMGAYQNLFNGVDNFNQSTMPALTDFANRGMNTAYQRPRIGAVGTGGGYGGDVQPGGLLSTGGRSMTAPQTQSLGQIDWTKVNPFAKG